MEPWLDSLSEDWNSLPRSVASPNASQRTPATGKLATKTGKKPPTKIPRLKQDRLSNNFSSSPKHATPKSSPPKRRRVLSERSISDINIPSHSSPVVTNSKPMDLHSSGTSSADSNASVVHHGPEKYRSRSSSPPRLKDYATPEWRRLAHNPSSQLDLFSPLALEGMFEKPQTSLPTRKYSRLQLLSDMDSMPSSPPPWPSSHRSQQLSLARRKSTTSVGALSILKEQEELNINQERTNLTKRDECKPEDLDTALPKNMEASQLSTLGNEKEVEGSKNLLHEKPITEVGQTFTTYTPSKLDMSASPEGSSLNSGFSPVFITKHNTVDGNVDYNALDLSNPEVVRQLQRMSVNGNIDTGGLEHPETPGVIPINEFVNIERGQSSDDTLFQRKPLSASASSSLVPSDSVSQVTLKINALLDQFPSPSNLLSSARRSSSAGAITKHTYQATMSAAEAKPAEVRSKSSGSPLKLFDNHDTFTNNRLLRRMSRLDDFEVQTGIENQRSSMKHSENESYQVIEAGSGAIASAENLFPQLTRPSEEQVILQNKRPGSSPFKPPTPKRQRTLHQDEMNASTEPHNNTVQEYHHQMQAIIGKKRKDARYDDYQEPVDPEELAKRQILKPRNPALHPNHPVGQTDDQIVLSDSFMSNKSKIEIVQEHIEKLPLPPNILYPQQIRAIATELATVRLNHLPNLNGEVRKHSVSTQDYLDEAMKIMDMIRSKARPETGLHQVEVFDFESAEHGPIDFGPSTPLTISRPPSREGPASAWRTRNDHTLDPGLVNHLQKYQEAEDESFMIESATRSFDLLEDNTKKDERIESEPCNLRITQGINASASSDAVNIETIDLQSLPKTHSSNPSTDSTGRTVGTTSSQKYRTLPVIPPEKVSHLISGDEAGMRFDKEKQVWVKCKQSSPAKGDEPGSSSTISEDDPFGQIPDLSVNEGEERLRVQSRDSGSLQTFHEVSERKPAQSEIDLHDVAQIQDLNEKDLGLLAKHGEHMDALDGCQTNESDDSTMEVEDNFPETKPLTVTPSDTVRSRKQRETSVLFSSPVVSHWRDPKRWGENDEDSPTNMGPNDSSHNDHQTPVYDRFGERHASNSRVSHANHSQRHGFPNRFEFQRMSFNGTEEHREMSLIETRPDGRTVSLTLSVSTPLPAQRALSTRLSTSSIAQCQHSSHSLSPLSDFTIHRDDQWHLESRNLIKHGGQLTTNRTDQNTALSLNNLVEKIMDAEPTELYWDSMRVLSLKNKDLDTVNLLDDLCPELEDLDISSNKLSQLIGAPTKIRSLDVCSNQLTSLTSWSHLKNLQYVDISRNDIDNLDGFSDLVHLRELKAEHNRITNLEGVLDLDGLLVLNLKGNHLLDIDFETSALKRLAVLDLSQNTISSLKGLGWLPALRELNLSQNELSTFPAADEGLLHRLHTLNIKSNHLEILEVSGLLNLRTLNVDDNCISSISGIENLKDLHTLSLRSQKGTTKFSSLCHFSQVSHLYLASNHITNINLHNKSMLSLQTLELSSTGLQILPPDFSRLCPNIRTLNLNTNALQDLSPLRGIRKLRKLFVAGNRLNRLRRTLAITSGFEELEVLDLRDNPLTFGFHPPTSCRSVVTWPLNETEEEENELELQHMLPDGEEQLDRQYTERLDEDTRLRRRVYELLLATGRSTCLQKVDGLVFKKDEILRKDETWERLMGLGVVERVSSKDEGAGI